MAALGPALRRDAFSLASFALMSSALLFFVHPLMMATLIAACRLYAACRPRRATARPTAASLVVCPEAGGSGLNMGVEKKVRSEQKLMDETKSRRQP